MALISVHNRWLNSVGPVVLSAIIFAAVLVWLGDTRGHAVAYSVVITATLATLQWLHTHRRDARRRRRQTIGA